MESTIQYIQFSDNGGHIDICVKCNHCNKTNTHVITNASSSVKNTTVIDFNNLDSRACHNCYKQYKLYQ